MNRFKRICKACGVEFVADAALPDAPDCRVTFSETCESCCPEHVREEEES